MICLSLTIQLVEKNAMNTNTKAKMYMLNATYPDKLGFFIFRKLK